MEPHAHEHPQILHIALKSPPSRSLAVETGLFLSVVCPAGGRRDAGPGPAGPRRHGSAPAGHSVMVGLTPWLLRHHRGFSPLNRFPLLVTSPQLGAGNAPPGFGLAGYPRGGTSAATLSPETAWLHDLFINGISLPYNLVGIDIFMTNKVIRKMINTFCLPFPPLHRLVKELPKIPSRSQNVPKTKTEWLAHSFLAFVLCLPPSRRVRELWVFLE